MVASREAVQWTGRVRSLLATVAPKKRPAVMGIFGKSLDYLTSGA
jgi:hypothetical protein